MNRYKWDGKDLSKPICKNCGEHFCEHIGWDSYCPTSEKGGAGE
jgi:hypothetical protein